MARTKAAQAAIDGVLSLHLAKGQVGLGVDIVEVSRMRKILERTSSFAQKTFSEEECTYCDSKPDPAIHYAARFAAKEAVVKALSCGFTGGIGVRDIEVVREKSGQPKICLHGRAKEVAESLQIVEIPVSLSHTKTDAIACAIAITEKAKEKAELPPDPKRELANKFREARGILDEL